MSKKDRQSNWNERSFKKQQFYLTEREKKDGESSKIHRWMELADQLFENDDSDPTPSRT